MCGLTGLLRVTADQTAGSLVTAVTCMADTLRHRGPDDDGVWIDAAVGVALGFRRLAIVDLSPAGHQPMLSASGRFVLVFNGEVYNHRELRERLQAEGALPPLRGHSDTEIILACIEAWGMERAVRAFVGMFAFALWDRTERTLSLVRDRLGVKPLYYGRAGDTFLFGSELKALRAHPDFRAPIDRDSICLLMRYAYIAAPYSIYKGIYKLPQGTILTLRSGQRETPEPKPYWSVRQTIESGAAQPFRGDDQEALHRLDSLLRDAIGLRMIADVPLGVFLSGGVDSSTVAALMQAQSSRPIRTFSIGFAEEAYNEAPHARAVACHLGTDHTELIVSPAEARAVIPRLPTLYDEPFADSSQIPTLLVSELARRHVTVSLSGDGGDELFAGYNRYLWGSSVWERMTHVPRPLRSLAAGSLNLLSPHGWDALFNTMESFLPARFRQRTPGDKLVKLAAALGANSPDTLYRGLVSHCDAPEGTVIGAQEPATLLTNPTDWPCLPNFIDRMMYLDLCTYLPDDILVKVDRASMGVSLEAREPLLDHRLLEFAWQLPQTMKIRDGQGKWLLRQALYQYVPREFIERPKMGFAIPFDSWLRGPLRDWAEALLDEHRLQQEGYLQAAPIRKKWREHLSGRRNWQYYLWNVLMFQAWLEQTRV